MRILFLNPQGNFNPLNSYINQHPDFGGQLVYVRDVSKAIVQMGHDVDIVTRKIVDKDWLGFEETYDKYPDTDGLRIVRIKFGGDKFLRKEDLWPHIEEYVDNIIDFYKQKNTKIDFITSHYGDGGIAAALLSEKIKVPYIFTGHSLGPQKLDNLLVSGGDKKELNDRFNFNTRICAERISMNRSAVNIVSTFIERTEQYGHKAYDGAIDVNDDTRFKQIAPGINLRIFNDNRSGDSPKWINYYKRMVVRDIEPSRRLLPFIAAASRLDGKKNHIGMLKAYSYSKKLQEKSNLLFVVRGVKNPYINYDHVPDEDKKVLSQMMDYIDKHNLRGKVCFVNAPGQHYIAMLYRFLADRKSIFSSIALSEPFGLSIIEAMACGLPVVATKNGGPAETLVDQDRPIGCLVDPLKCDDIANGYLNMLANREKYKKLSLGVVRAKYTWEHTAQMYMLIINEILERERPYSGNIKIEDFINLVKNAHVKDNQLNTYIDMFR